MCITCTHVWHMSVMIQIRNVPSGVHRKLRERALAAGMSLSEFLLREVTAVATRPTLEDVFERISRRSPPPKNLTDSVAAVRSERDARR